MGKKISFTGGGEFCRTPSLVAKWKKIWVTDGVYAGRNPPRRRSEPQHRDYLSGAISTTLSTPRESSGKLSWIRGLAARALFLLISVRALAPV